MAAMMRMIITIRSMIRLRKLTVPLLLRRRIAALVARTFHRRR